MKTIQIAIDGPAGSGKSTVAKLISKELGILYLDTGAMYRALTLFMLNHEMDVKDESSLRKAFDSAHIHFDQKCVLLNGEDVTLEIRKPEVTENVSYVAMNPYVRAAMVKAQQKIAGNQSVVMDGRDIGTHVLPNAKFKFFLVASTEERAKRRLAELLEKGYRTTLEALMDDIEKRDAIDSGRACAPLKQAEDAMRLDTTLLSINEVVQAILTVVRRGI